MTQAPDPAAPSTPFTASTPVAPGERAGGRAGGAGAVVPRLRFDVVTLFPELFEPHLRCGVTRRAFDASTGCVHVRLWPLRDFADGAYRRVDDRPFGGGPGMVLLAEPLERALAALRAERVAERVDHAATRPCEAADGAPGSRPPSPPAAPDAPGVSGVPGVSGDPGAPTLPVVHFTPAGRSLTQSLVREFAAGGGAVLLCGRYEGLDQRVVDRHVTHEISLGDFVLSGGELPALALLDAVARLQPGVIEPDSAAHESFEDGLLEAPHYSRPQRLDEALGGRGVPDVLVGGDHARIARWRRDEQLRRTAARRPDLIAAARAASRLDARDERVLREWSDRGSPSAVGEP